MSELRIGVPQEAADNVFSVVSPMLLYICWSVFSRHSREGGNPELFVFKDNGFPITTSGMTINAFFQEILCRAIYETLH